MIYNQKNKIMNTNTKTIYCKKLLQDLPALEKPPFNGPIGEKIFQNISAQAWKMWREDMQIKVLNEYRLNMSDKNDYQKLVDQMLRFLNLQDGDVVETENSERGKGS